ncbi:beta-N-acetylglucosaminidase domain-containing protein [Clostridium chauvoei]|uniref:beta-N-acetylglucosaminidase domain-containing protein n=1 Tax=Clostridium chauvoei TaxID=46867 RepID=UPI001C85C5CC|nr:beta-N-acetylglucosaminidase domain-containing protein [Clostridium chauvoei]MBX7355324.1 beta-N-acetylglucosaminidase domain-containing protein [Clostridium chauvoei]
MKKKSKKIFQNALATTCAVTIVTTMAGGKLIRVETITKEGEIVKANIYPVPQDLKYSSEEGMSLEGEVNVVVHGTQEEATLPKLEEVLNENNIKYSISDAVNNDKANIIISSEKDHCEDCIKGKLEENNVLSKKEAYILKSSNDENKKGNISIIGSDADGVYYGVLTLAQILEQSTSEDKFAEVIISDYPEIEFRGFIEGFYGTPWSHEDRMNLMKDTSKFKMNTYIYAPKDDPYHRKQWKELYPEDKANQIAELAKAGKDNNFNFCWTIHPGATLKFTDEDYDALIMKFEQLYSLGVRQFGVLFDDTDDWYNGRKQAEWINKIDTEFVKAKGDVAPMIVISARYNSAWGPNMNVYFKPFMETLHDDIQVMWTGHATMSNVSKDVFEWPKAQTGVNKEVAVWWNYPVNDYCDSRILMAPLHNLSKDLDNVSGFFSNPMNQAQASKVALYSIADYTWNTDSFDYMNSWETSINKLVPEVCEEFKRFASNTCYLKDDGGASGPFEYDESGYLAEKIDGLKSAITNKENVKDKAAELLAEFKTMSSDYDAIKTKTENANLLAELDSFLNSYKALSEAGIASMNALIAAQDGDIETWLNENSLASEKLALMDTFKVARLEDDHGNIITKEYVVSVGEKRLKPLVKEAIGVSQSIISNSILANYEPKVISSIEDILNKEVEVSGGNYTINSIENVTLNKGDYIGIALPKAMKLGAIKVKASSYNNLSIEYSINGIEWSKAEATVEDGTLKTNDSISATYVRILNDSKAPVTINIESLQTNPVYKANPTISQNIGTYQNYVIENALDGNMDTKYWSDKASGNGHYIQLDLGNTIPLHDVSAYFNGGDYMRNSEFMISKDGSTWTSLGALEYSDKDGKKVASVDAKGEMAKYIKIQANGENNGSWVQLCELQFNKTVPELGDDTVELVTGTPEGNWKNLHDGDLSTAFEAESVQNGDALVYKMSRVTKVSELSILQDANNICGAKVSVKGANGKWTDIGALDNQLNKLNVSKEIVEVKLTFDPSKPLPKIYEIIAKEGNIVEDDVIDKENFKRHLEIAVSEAKKIDATILDKVVPAVKKEFNDALIEAEEVLKDSKATQKQIDDSFERLSKVMHMVSFEKGDKEALIGLVDKISTLNSNEYIKEPWDKLQGVLEEVNAVIADKNVMKNEVSENYDKLLRAFLDLRLKPSKEKLQDLINEAEKKDRNEFTTESFAVLENEILNAKAVIEKEDATEEEIGTSEKALNLAVKGLVASAENKDETNSSETAKNKTTKNEESKNITTLTKNDGKKNKLPKTGMDGLGNLQTLGAIFSSLGAALLLKKKSKNK